MTLASTLGRALLAAVAIIATSAALAWLAPAYISTDLSHRLLGAMLGAVVVVYSNAIPKMLVSLSKLRCPSAEDQAARRFAGRSLVLGGLAYSLAWLVAPIGLAALIGGAALAASLVAAIVRCMRIGANGPAT